jgi:SAM-dependent methyltransferase
MTHATIRQHYEGVETLPNAHFYKQIPMLCAAGLHELIEETALRYLARGERVLNVGCGRGAFSLRMHDRGFDVDACDLLDLCMCKEQVRFRRVSAEQAAYPPGSFDALFLLELIEHTESPFGVIRKCVNLVKPGGYLFISTPNVDSDISRAWFLLTGRHWYYEDQNVTGDGHITPVHDFQLKYLFDDLGLDLVETVSMKEGRTIRRGVLWAVLKALRAYQRLKGLPPQEGEAKLYVVRRPA